MASIGSPMGITSREGAETLNKLVFAGLRENVQSLTITEPTELVNKSEAPVSGRVKEPDAFFEKMNKAFEGYVLDTTIPEDAGGLRAKERAIGLARAIQEDLFSQTDESQMRLRAAWWIKAASGVETIMTALDIQPNSKFSSAIIRPEFVTAVQERGRVGAVFFNTLREVGHKLDASLNTPAAKSNLTVAEGNTGNVNAETAPLTAAIMASVTEKVKESIVTAGKVDEWIKGTTCETIAASVVKFITVGKDRFFHHHYFENSVKTECIRMIDDLKQQSDADVISRAKVWYSAHVEAVTYLIDNSVTIPDNLSVGQSKAWSEIKAVITEQKDSLTNAQVKAIVGLLQGIQVLYDVTLREAPKMKPGLVAPPPDID